jgi:2-methylcitrate synthase/citrate synthase II
MSEQPYYPGLEGVIAGETSISTIAGGLRYRGYDVKDLAEHSTFEDTAYLLFYGELPDDRTREEFRARLARQAVLPQPIVDALGSFPAGTSMMDVLRSAASMLAHFDPDVADNSKAANLRKAERLLAQLPVALATRFRQEQGREPVAADPQRASADNLLYMLHGRSGSADAVRGLDITLVLYAEHEFNASTFTARVVASTLSDVHSSITAAIGALKGPLHGGANERVMEILEQVGSADRAEAWIADQLARKQRVMGFGHRVYKAGDPRAEYLKSFCERLAEASGQQNLETMAGIIERVLEREKKLHPNLDWPSARLYHYLGLPVPLYTPLFVVSRVSGWCAHVIEQLESNRLIRPRARYTGPGERRVAGR